MCPDPDLSCAPSILPAGLVPSLMGAHTAHLAEAGGATGSGGLAPASASCPPTALGGWAL